MEKVKEQVKFWMIEGIQVLNGEEDNIKLLYTRPYDVIEYIESIGGIDEDNGEDFDCRLAMGLPETDYI